MPGGCRCFQTARTAAVFFRKISRQKSRQPVPAFSEKPVKWRFYRPFRKSAYFTIKKNPADGILSLFIPYNRNMNFSSGKPARAAAASGQRLPFGAYLIRKEASAALRMRLRMPPPCRFFPVLRHSFPGPAGPRNPPDGVPGLKSPHILPHPDGRRSL